MVEEIEGAKDLRIDNFGIDFLNADGETLGVAGWVVSAGTAARLLLGDDSGYFTASPARTTPTSTDRFAGVSFSPVSFSSMSIRDCGSPGVHRSKRS